MSPRILGPTGDPWEPDEADLTPTEADVERYVRTRKASSGLADAILDTVPRRARHAIGRALGMLRDGAFVFDSEDMTSVLMDCCLYDWIEDGRNLVEKFAEKHAPAEGSDEREALDSMLGARYTLLRIEERVPGKGVRASEFLDRGEVFLIDIGLSRSAGIERLGMASRLLPLGRHWMTSGTALPMAPDAVERFMDTLEERVVPASPGRLFENHGMVLAAVRSCLEAGAADHVRFRDPDDDWPEARPERPAHAGPGRTPRNSPCPCGSGQKYKRCCGRKGQARRPA